MPRAMNAEQRWRLAIGLAGLSCILFLQAQAKAGETVLTVEQARQIVAPLYDALNEPAAKDVVALLGKATNPNYRSCSTNQDCLDRDQLAGQFKYFGSVIPDLRWKIVDIWASGNRIVVRGEATGTPAKPLFGTAPTGRSFRTMSIDTFTVEHGKLSTAYHVENWEAAIAQIKQP